MNKIIFEMQKLSNVGLHDKFAIVNNVAYVSSNILFRTIENIITKRANRTATIEHFTEIIQDLQDIIVCPSMHYFHHMLYKIIVFSILCLIAIWNIWTMYEN